MSDSNDARRAVWLRLRLIRIVLAVHGLCVLAGPAGADLPAGSFGTPAGAVYADPSWNDPPPGVPAAIPRDVPVTERIVPRLSPSCPFGSPSGGPPWLPPCIAGRSPAPGPVAAHDRPVVPPTGPFHPGRPLAASGRCPTGPPRARCVEFGGTGPVVADRARRNAFSA